MKAALLLGLLDEPTTRGSKAMFMIILDGGSNGLLSGRTQSHCSNGQLYEPVSSSLVSLRAETIMATVGWLVLSSLAYNLCIYEDAHSAPIQAYLTGLWH